MSITDPFREREAEKYENPIPSREAILALIEKQRTPVSRDDLMKLLKLQGEEQEEALRRRLRAMERDGQLIYTRRGTYAPVDKLDLILGRIAGHRDGFGFLVPDDGSDDLFMSPAQMRLVFDGDRALARVSGLDRRGRREGVIVEVVSRAHETIVGRYFEEGGIGFVVADNPKIQQEVLVTPGRNAGAKVGQFVEVKITHWPTPRFQPQGDIVEVVGNYMAPGMEIDVALRSYDIPHVWPDAVVAEAASAVMAAVYMACRVPELCPERGQWRIRRALLGPILRYGSVTALQQAVQPICKVLIQGQVNALGVGAIAAFNAVTRVDDFAFTPEQSIATAITTYIAQNRGAGQTARIRRGFAVGLRLELGYWLLMGSLTLLLRRGILSLFVAGEGAADVIALGSTYLGWMAVFYALPALTNGFQGFYRGMGKMTTTLIGTCIQAGLRAAAAAVLAPRVGLRGIAFACAFGWCVMLAFEVPYYFWTCREL